MQVTEWHQQYIAALEALFEKHKAEAVAAGARGAARESRSVPASEGALATWWVPGRLHAMRRAGDQHAMREVIRAGAIRSPRGGCQVTQVAQSLEEGLLTTMARLPREEHGARAAQADERA